MSEIPVGDASSSGYIDATQVRTFSVSVFPFTDHFPKGTALVMNVEKAKSHDYVIIHPPSTSGDYNIEGSQIKESDNIGRGMQLGGKGVLEIGHATKKGSILLEYNKVTDQLHKNFYQQVPTKKYPWYY
jgi:hypothetical protein